MPDKCRFSDKEKSKIAEKMSDFILLMGYNADFQVIIAKELSRQVWLTSENLGRKQCRELLYLLYMADTATLLSFTVSLGKLIWETHLRAKRRILNRKVKERGRLKKQRRLGKPGLVVMLTQRKGNPRWLRLRIGFRMRPIFRYRLVRRRRAVERPNIEVGSRMFRLGLAMGFLSFRNVCVTSEWEFWAVCLIQQVFGFWRSIAIGGGLSGSFVQVATKFGFDVVSCERLDRLQSCFRCSSTTRYLGCGRD